MNDRVTLGRIVSFLGVCLLLASPVVAQDMKVDPVGTWKLSVKSTSQGQRTSTIKISNKDGKLVGLYKGTRSGEVKASEVKLTGPQLSITLSADDIAEGLRAVYVGTIKGDSITGSVEYRVGDRSGKRDFTGSRAAVKNVPSPGAVDLGRMHKDVRYSDKYKRSVMDIWTTKSATPVPLVVNFHGGGFNVGDKRSFARSGLLKKYHPQGVAFASV
ncbi:MAG: hypothetical protein GY888_20060, partial [Planctomycetaceae bacterium]|nr:hypothetical protein [Planctomycetaceae bacterium]